jgi:L-ascorbate metabolism protein UlaG (beta-lactamase superfamily)
MMVRRRGVLLAATGTVLAGALEYASLSGRFDHRRMRPAMAADRYRASLARLDADPSSASGALVHVGHSTHLVSIGGLRALTDPWFYDPAFGALAHTRGPAVEPEDVGPLDLLLVSHDHPDHVDARAVDRLDKRARVFTATRDLAARIRALGFQTVEVLAPWESAAVGAVTVTATPAEHDVPEIGFVLQGGGRTAYFGGDTRLFQGIYAIGERFTPDLAILPVDGTRVTGSALQVMTPDDAAAAARALGAKLVVPSHAEAYLCDPLARYVLASTIEGADEIFVRSVAATGTARARAPLPGECVLFGSA